MFHRWMGCEDECSSCLTCGGHWSDDAIDAGDVSDCTGDTRQVHGDAYCDTCQTQGPCQHYYVTCDDDFCRG